MVQIPLDQNQKNLKGNNSNVRVAQKTVKILAGKTWTIYLFNSVDKFF